MPRAPLQEIIPTIAVLLRLLEVFATCPPARDYAKVLRVGDGGLRIFRLREDRAIRSHDEIPPRVRLRLDIAMVFLGSCPFSGCTRHQGEAVGHISVKSASCRTGTTMT